MSHLKRNRNYHQVADSDGAQAASCQNNAKAAVLQNIIKGFAFSCQMENETRNSFVNIKANLGPSPNKLPAADSKLAEWRLTFEVSKINRSNVCSDTV